MFKRARQQQRLLLLFAFIVLGYFASQFNPNEAYSPANDSATGAIDAAFQRQQSDVQLQLSGVVTRLLPDDVTGSRHQRFIVTVPSGLTVLVAHNIDLAPRIDQLSTGDTVQIYGEYEWNTKGGVIHWTHHDPAGRHPNGWIIHHDQRYQ